MTASLRVFLIRGGDYLAAKQFLLVPWRSLVPAAMELDIGFMGLPDLGSPTMGPVQNLTDMGFLDAPASSGNPPPPAPGRVTTLVCHSLQCLLALIFCGGCVTAFYADPTDPLGLLAPLDMQGAGMGMMFDLQPSPRTSVPQPLGGIPSGVGMETEDSGESLCDSVSESVHGPSPHEFAASTTSASPWSPQQDTDNDHAITHAHLSEVFKDSPPCRPPSPTYWSDSLANYTP